MILRRRRACAEICFGQGTQTDKSTVSLPASIGDVAMPHFSKTLSNGTILFVYFLKYMSEAGDDKSERWIGERSHQAATLRSASCTRTGNGSAESETWLQVKLA